MATFVAVTTSNDPRVNDPEAACTVVESFYWDGDVRAVIYIPHSAGPSLLSVYGYDWPGAWRVPEGTMRDDFEPDYDVDSYDGFEEFLRAITPHLAEPLTIQAVGFENCRFPLAATEWHIKPGSDQIEINEFHHSGDDDKDDVVLDHTC